MNKFKRPVIPIIFHSRNDLLICIIFVYIREHIGSCRTDHAKMQFEEEQMREFYECHEGMPSFEQLASELKVDIGVVKFKFKALSYKNYELPNIPETRCDFLTNWRSTQQ